jgi:hypothetical protein
MLRIGGSSTGLVKDELAFGDPQRCYTEKASSTSAGAHEVKQVGDTDVGEAEVLLS